MKSDHTRKSPIAQIAYFNILQKNQNKKISRKTNVRNVGQDRRLTIEPDEAFNHSSINYKKRNGGIGERRALDSPVLIFN